MVLQGYSNGPITEDHAEPFRESAREFAADIRADGGEPVFFMTWAYTGQPDMTRQLDEAYTAIGAELNAMVVPVGRAFASALEKRPDLDLVVADRETPDAGRDLSGRLYLLRRAARRQSGRRTVYRRT